VRNVDVEGTPYRMLTTALPGGGAVQVASNVSDNQAALGGLRTRLLLVGGGGVLAAGLLGWAVARRTVGPVERLTNAAEHVAATQDLATPIEVSRSDEVGRLATAFNTMLTALDQSRRQQQRLVMDASHELRTPLTSLRTNIELLQRADDLDPTDRRRLIADVDTEIRELSDLVAELVDLAGDRRTEEPVAGLRLDEVVEAAVETARRRTGREIALSAEPVAVDGRRVMLERAVGNLIDNAHKWSPSGSPIEVTVVGGRVEVRDHGPGVAESDRSLIFERFYRSPDARSMPGSGLGLAIVKQIVEAHGGRVFADEAPGGGALIGFEIPVDVTARAAASPVG
jgi:two-component system sensor histidine kinase MprB